MEINKREFLLYPNKYIKMLEEHKQIVITNKRGETLVLMKASDVATKPIENVVTKPNVVTEPEITFAHSQLYGCGCKKEPGRYLCKSHSRY